MLEPVKVTYRCFREKCSCGFRAVCIDLDLATESVTPDGAVKSLFDAMIGYLDAFVMGPQQTKGSGLTVKRLFGSGFVIASVFSFDSRDSSI